MRTGRSSLQFRKTLVFQGDMPDGGGWNSVEMNVASIPAFLAMKGYALKGLLECTRGCVTHPKRRPRPHRTRTWWTTLRRAQIRLKQTMTTSDASVASPIKLREHTDREVHAYCRRSGSLP